MSCSDLHSALEAAGFDAYLDDEDALHAAKDGYQVAVDSHGVYDVLRVGETRPSAVEGATMTVLHFLPTPIRAAALEAAAEAGTDPVAAAEAAVRAAKERG